MTRLIYEDTSIVFETNGDGSEITINFLGDCTQLVKELRMKLKAQGFIINDKQGVLDTQLKILAKETE